MNICDFLCAPNTAGSTCIGKSQKIVKKNMLKHDPCETK